jgi:signal transduction histidine kinase
MDAPLVIAVILAIALATSAASVVHWRLRMNRFRRKTVVESEDAAALAAATLASLPLPIAVLDRAATILLVHDPVTGSGAVIAFGDGPPVRVGANFLAYSQQFGGTDATRVAAGLEAVCTGALPSWGGEWKHRQRDGERCFALRMTALRRPAGGAVLSYHDITARRQAERSLREVGGRLIAAQEYERHRIARDLHDDLSQRMALLAMDIEQLAVQPRLSPADLAARARALWQDVTSIATDLHHISHQLHPSKLDALGLVPSINGFCQELWAQHHLQVRFAHENVPRTVPREIALCLYRIVQEGLQNVIKHSGVTLAEVQLVGTVQELRLRIADSGRGFLADTDPSTGLGLISMRERVHSIGGEFAVTASPGRGTRIAVTVRLRSCAGVMQTA